MINDKLLRTAFGVALKKHRTDKGMSQQELADYSDLDRTYISGLENGKYQPTLTVVFKVCECLQISPEEFIAQVNKERGKSRNTK